MSNLVNLKDEVRARTVKVNVYPGERGLEFAFDNNRGASIINDGNGRHAGLYELAVLDEDGDLDYTTPITSDVIGWLTEDQAYELLLQIATLEPIVKEIP
jgi:hypothetical protein